MVSQGIGPGGIHRYGGGGDYAYASSTDADVKCHGAKATGFSCLITRVTGREDKQVWNEGADRF